MFDIMYLTSIIMIAYSFTIYTVFLMYIPLILIFRIGQVRMQVRQSKSICPSYEHSNNDAIAVYMSGTNANHPNNYSYAPYSNSSLFISFHFFVLSSFLIQQPHFLKSQSTILFHATNDSAES